MAVFRIPVNYSVWGIIEVSAETLEDAIKYSRNNIHELPLPERPEYIEDSYEVEEDDETIRSHNKGGQDGR